MKNSLIIGPRAIFEALQNADKIDQILIKQNSDNEKIREIIYLARKQGVTVKTVPIEKIQRITHKNHQGIIAFASPIDFYDITQIIPDLFEKGLSPKIVILDHITDVRNFGAIVRSCECFGIHAVIIPQKGGTHINEDAVKTSAGALLKIPVCKVGSLVSCVTYLQESGIQIISISEKATQALHTVSIDGPFAVILGAEDTGIQNILLEKSDMCLSIPMYGEISSLNVSVAAGICLYELTKQ